MDWHQRLTLSLKRRGWTRAELAKRSGVPFRDLVRYRGTPPKDAILDRIALALDVEPEWLRVGERANGTVRSSITQADREQSAFSLAVQTADRWETELFGKANIIAHTTLVTHLYQYIVDNDIRTPDELGPAKIPPGW